MDFYIFSFFRLNGSLDHSPEFAWMGCTVSFICCEDDLLQMPLDQHVEKKKEENKLAVKVRYGHMATLLCGQEHFRRKVSLTP